MSLFRKKRLFILLIEIIILVVLIDYSLRDRDRLTTAEQFVSDKVGWAQSVIYTHVNFFTDMFTNIGDIKKTYQENQLLKEKVSEYKTLIYEVQELKEENEELRESLEVTDSIRDYNSIQATVISRSPERWIDQVTINKGEQAGVKKNMAVITAEGMVGKFISTSKFTTSVQMLTEYYIN